MAFEHLDGMGLIPAMKALKDGGILDLLPAADSEEFITLSSLCSLKETAARGYLGVALRAMASQGWVEMRDASKDPMRQEWAFRFTKEGEIAKSYLPYFDKAAQYIPVLVRMKKILFDKKVPKALQRMYRNAIREMAAYRWELPQEKDELRQKVRNQILRHLDGVVVGPVMVALGRQGVFEKFSTRDGELSIRTIEKMEGNTDNIIRAFSILATQGWTVGFEDAIALTPAGKVAIQKPYSYGVPSAYNRMAKKYYEMTFVNPDLPRIGEKGTELLVNREMNIWGSNGAHENYFKQVEKIIQQIFDNDDFENQPKGLCDVGCGKGGLLE